MRAAGCVLLEESPVDGRELLRESLGGAEIQNAQPAVREHEEVAGMGIGMDEARRVERAPDGEDQQPGNPEPLFARRVGIDEIEQRLPMKPREAQHALRAALGDDVGDDQLGVALRGGTVGVRLRRLLYVIQLAEQRRPQLVVIDPSVQRLTGEREPAHQDRRVGEVVLQRLFDPGVLHLHHHLATVVQERPMHLPERGRGERLAVESGEQLVRRAAQLRPHHLGDLGELHPLRRLREEPRHHAPRLFRERVWVHRQGLTELERRPFQLAERGEDAFARLAQVVVPRALAGQLATRLGSEEIAGRARGEICQPAQPADPAGRDVIVVGHSLPA